MVTSNRFAGYPAEYPAVCRAENFSPLNRTKEFSRYCTVDSPSPRQLQESRDSTIDFDQYLVLSLLSCACVGEGDSTVLNFFERLRSSTRYPAGYPATKSGISFYRKTWKVSCACATHFTFKFSSLSLMTKLIIQLSKSFSYIMLTYVHNPITLRLCNNLLVFYFRLICSGRVPGIFITNIEIVFVTLSTFLTSQTRERPANNCFLRLFVKKGKFYLDH
jgi:hypothetical protein